MNYVRFTIRRRGVLCQTLSRAKNRYLDSAFSLTRGGRASTFMRGNRFSPKGPTVDIETTMRNVDVSERVRSATNGPIATWMAMHLGNETPRPK